jgi:hypothetical protein
LSLFFWSLSRVYGVFESILVVCFSEALEFTQGDVEHLHVRQMTLLACEHEKLGLVAFDLLLGALLYIIPGERGHVPVGEGLFLLFANLDHHAHAREVIYLFQVRTNITAAHMRHVAAITLKAIPAMNRKALVSLLSLFIVEY